MNLFNSLVIKIIINIDYYGIDNYIKWITNIYASLLKLISIQLAYNEFDVNFI